MKIKNISIHRDLLKALYRELRRSDLNSVGAIELIKDNEDRTVIFISDINDGLREINV